SRTLLTVLTGNPSASTRRSTSVTRPPPWASRPRSPRPLQQCGDLLPERRPARALVLVEFGDRLRPADARQVGILRPGMDLLRDDRPDLAVVAVEPLRPCRPIGSEPAERLTAVPGFRRVIRGEFVAFFVRRGQEGGAGGVVAMRRSRVTPKLRVDRHAGL